MSLEIRVTHLALHWTMLAGKGEAASLPICLQGRVQVVNYICLCSLYPSFAIGDEVDREDVLQMDPGRGELGEQSLSSFHRREYSYLVQEEGSGVGAEHLVINIHHQFPFTCFSTLQVLSL